MEWGYREGQPLHSKILLTVERDRFTHFEELFDISEGRGGVVVTFSAILELLKQSLIEMVQTEAFGPIHVKAISSSEPESESESESESE